MKQERAAVRVALAEFVLSAASASDWPPPGPSELAFAGRSNVGKSSLVNALTGRRMLARTSNTPGRTRQINFFDLDARLMLVDLPGYGYAEAPKTEVRRWTALLRGYLPAGMTSEQVESEVRAVIAELKPSGPNAFGAVMKAATARLAGRAEGAQVAAAARKLLAS